MGRFREPRTIARYAVLAALVIVLGGLALQREFLSGNAGGAGEDAAYGVIDGHRAAVDQIAPDFTVPGMDGEPLRLSDLRGRLVVLNFWATWCPPCRAEMPEFQRLWDERGADGGDLVVLAVDFQEPPDLVGGFVEEFGLTFPIGLDRRGEIAEHYGVRGLPATFFIDRQGVIREMTLGPVLGDLLSRGLAAAERGESTRP